MIDLPSFYVDFDGQYSNDPDYRSTTRDVRKLLIELTDKDKINGLVIDLRGNGGGALTEAISLTGLFIRKGPVVQVKNSQGKVQVDRDPDPEIIYDGPLVVLVDRYSASASEIFAGAIQDYRRGLIIGEPTFGKGTVQNLVRLNRFSKDDKPLGQLKVTIAQFFRINGDSTQHRGVIPDIIWPTHTANNDIGERAYENALPWRHIHDTSFVPWRDIPAPALFSNTYESHQQRVKLDPEFQYVVELNNLNQQRRDRKAVSLLDSKRELDRKLFDEERLSIENKKRTAIGDEVLATIDDLDAYNTEQSEIKKEDKKPDIFLRESSRILSDYIIIARNIADPAQGFASQIPDSTKESVTN